MPYIENKYINFLSNRLLRFKRKSENLFTFRCCFCGDSKDHPNKTRGYFYLKGGTYAFYCHNCMVSMPFKLFLKKYDPHLYKQFLMETMGIKKQPKPIPQAEIFARDVILKLPSIFYLSNDAKKYCLDRKIDVKWYKEIFYAEKFKTFVNELVPEKFKHVNDDEPRIVFPFYGQDGKLFAFTGRSLPGYNDEVKYYMIRLDNMSPKIFGLNRVNFNEKYYVVEGPIDSLFLPNCIASADASLTADILHMGVNRDNAIIVYDNEPRNKAIVDQISKAINQKFNVCIWPSRWEYKDINDAILAGYTSDSISKTIDENTHFGMEAQLRFAKWKKI